MITFPAETSRSHTLAASRTLSSGEPSSPQPSSCRRKTTTFYLSVLFLFLAIIPCVYAAQIEVQADGSTIPPATSNDEGFGVDASWPMQRYDPSKLLRKDAYQDYMEGCYQHANERTCDFNDEERLELNAHQPPKMANYTAAGYAKLKLPGDIREIFDIAWETNSPHRMRNERWRVGNIYVNHWEVTPQVVSWAAAVPFPDQKRVVEYVQSTLEQWTGKELKRTSVYGIRVYQRGSILAPHVDRLPLVSSAIINVAQDVDEPWPLEVIGHDGKATNITMEPGDMILYESHSVIHGRPYPFNGDYFANIFIHFIPVDLDLKQVKQTSRPINFPRDTEAMVKRDFERAAEEPPENYRKSRKRLPDFIRDKTIAAKQWLQEYVFDRTEIPDSPKHATKHVVGVTDAHRIAANGNVQQMKELFASKPELLNQKDGNGWQPIHEAARSGRTEIVEYLVKRKAQLSERTNRGLGGTPLWWAENALPDGHPVIEILRQNGAVAIAPHAP